jgi:hypothetical protein
MTSDTYLGRYIAQRHRRAGIVRVRVGASVGRPKMGPTLDQGIGEHTEGRHDRKPNLTLEEREMEMGKRARPE